MWALWFGIFFSLPVLNSFVLPYLGQDWKLKYLKAPDNIFIAYGFDLSKCQELSVRSGELLALVEVTLLSFRFSTFMAHVLQVWECESEYIMTQVGAKNSWVASLRALPIPSSECSTFLWCMLRLAYLKCSCCLEPKFSELISCLTKNSYISSQIGRKNVATELENLGSKWAICP